MRGTSYFVTYSQVGDRDYAIVERTFVSAFGPKLATWHLAVEQHATGGIHWHVIARFYTAPSSRMGLRQFDIDGVHPNVKTYVIMVHQFCQLLSSYN
jgi:hypothetical protein